ncbi:hypothetical protein PTSG_04682 [Salpingoeca rosetta]|uniref:Palmitoyltransferase n=1 Tax=Salpingoeca rosetta (strain ATCC 50818 / BSB-021) TaxID=946362 RepID=F2U846_SALR5|nr:uncharacterized protein PTSG_04682 [Salpingoeca rosetta]EGD72951.1 hypothetical protein PTSG_04682 [Salpingoeca rosetta]|eukprot:XP_004994773.1 hypothetical protein PTSG_04682 [Salpingoeca rosetta]
MAFHQTPLHYAVIEGNEAAAYSLVACGADVHAVDHEHDTMLHWAASRGHLNLIRFFISQGLDVNAADMYGQTPLHAASINGDAACVQLLVDRGADVSVRDSNGYTAYDLAKREPKKREGALLFFRVREQQAKLRGFAWLLRRMFFTKDGESQVWQRFVLLAFVCSNYIYFGWVHPFLPPLHALLFLSVQVAMWGLWMWVARRDPGTFRPTASRVQQYEAALRNFASPNITSEEAEQVASRFCHTCRVVRPPRVHHSSVSNSCIVDYDHACDFMGHVIAINNRRQFMLTIFMLALLTSFIAVKVYLLQPAFPRTVAFWVSYLVLLASASFCIQLVGSHALYVSRGLTLAEAVKRKFPDGSPYNRGLLRNWAHFCGTTPTPAPHKPPSHV